MTQQQDSLVAELEQRGKVLPRSIKILARAESTTGGVGIIKRMLKFNPELMGDALTPLHFQAKVGRPPGLLVAGPGQVLKP